MSKNLSETKAVIQRISDDLFVKPTFIEKDWYAMRIMGVLSDMKHDNLQLVFSGGTSLSKGFGIVQRFSEDLDFKVIMNEPATRSQRTAFRETFLSKLQQNPQEWQPDLDKLLVGNSSKFFQIPVDYPIQFPTSTLVRPYIQLEVSFEQPAIAPEMRPLQSFVGMALKQAPETEAFPCISPIETAANKLSALTWRVLSRDRASPKDDPSLVRHLHDLAELKETVQNSDVFKRLVLESLAKDVNRAQYVESSASPQDQLRALENMLRSDAIYQTEYQQFVFNMSYAEQTTRPDFEQSLSSLGTLIEIVSAYSERLSPANQSIGSTKSEQLLSPSMQAEAQSFLGSFLESAIKSLIANMDRASGILEVDSGGTKSFRSKDFLWSMKADDSVSLTRLSDGKEITPQTVTGSEMDAIRTFIVKINQDYGLKQDQSSEKNPPNQSQKSQRPKL